MDEPGFSASGPFGGFGPDQLLNCYATGVFPMGEARDDPRIFLVEPEQRGIIPLDGFRIPSRLRRTVRSEAFVLPALDRMRSAAPVQLGVQPADRPVDPAVLTTGSGSRAGVQNCGEGGVDPHLERIAPDGPLEPAGNAEAVQRDDAALLWLDQEDPRVVTALAHREHSGGVAVQQFVGTEAAEGIAGAETGLVHRA